MVFNSSLATHFDNPIVYHLLIDRFAPPARAQSDPTAFHGGTLRGVVERLRDGWFSRLGVNGIWLSMPFEQIRGWYPGAGGTYRHEAYHGYWPLDFTRLDARFGQPGDLQELLALAHGMGIRVILDVVLGHAGYPELQTFQELLPQALLPGWEQATPADYRRYFDPASPALQQWWGSAWVSADLPGYAPVSAEETFWLPQFRLADRTPVALPRFLQQKSDTGARELPGHCVRDYLVSWLTEWVRQFGIDGFRCDSAKHVPLDAWRALKDAACAAYALHSDGAFWMTGEVWGAGAERSEHFDHGFDSLINFDFQREAKQLFGQAGSQAGYLRSLALHRLDKLYARYARTLADGGHDILSFLSSHDTELFDRKRIADGALALMLAPGGVQIFYGDESGRPAGPAPALDPAQATRSDMNWDTTDQTLLQHWQRLGQFRARHIALARGEHDQLCQLPYVFGRRHAASGDRVVVAIGDEASARLPVAGYFADGQCLRDAYSGRTAVVTDGHAILPVDGVALLEKA